MSPNGCQLKITATKPKGNPAAMLADMGIAVVGVEGDEGDVDRYLLSKRVAVERRTGSGFLRGIQDKTLFTSAIYLREHFRVPILIVEGQVHYTYSAFNPQAVRGAMSSMMLLYGINVLATPDVAETVALIAMIARQEQVGIPDISLIPKRKAVDLADLQRRIIEMLPGSGMVLARDLLQHFGSVRRIAGATEAELRALRGIGAKKAKQIHQVLNAEYEAIDTERNLEDAIQTAPGLLFKKPVTLLARQHYLYTDCEQRNFVDLVFHDPRTNELILVELKRGRLAREHADQLRRYLDSARQSKLLRGLLDKGAKLRGILATVEPSDWQPRDEDISTRVVDKKAAIAVLKQLRARALSAARTVPRSGTRSRKRRPRPSGGN